jgi:hypothetical protein
MSRVGVKHLVKCVCVLPQLSKLPKPPSHEFTVFSVYDDSNNEFESTFVQCSNCGIVHKITDICMSTILRGREDLSSVITLNDVKNAIPEKLVAVLEHHKADLPTWQQVSWIVENKLWGSSVVLTSEYIDGTRQGKSLVVMGESIFKIVPFTNETATENK